MATNPFENAPVRDAVTAILQCGDEVLLLRRQPQLAAFAGYEAFSGGKVDAGDLEHAPSDEVFSGLDRRLLGALTRELREELTLDLAALATAGEIEHIGMAGFALTPPLAPVRFATHFYHIRLRQRPALNVDLREHSAAQWATPQAWLDRYAQGRLLLAPPTLFALRDLANDPRVETLPSLIHFAHDPRNSGGGIIEVETLAGLTQLLVRSNTIPPAAHTNCFLIGDDGATRLLVDPSPADDTEYKKLCAQVEGRFDIIFLTHHHPDHHERADRLARQTGAPLWLSADTQQRIAAKQTKFFGGLDTRAISDGDSLTRWLGHDVRALAVPGHDRGQLALMPDDRAWCIVGDLIQGIGTVVISPPEGNMAEYFATLENIIALDPAVIVPSHGLALGSTYYLQRALSHRQAREAQILKLYQAGKSEDEVLATVYAGTPSPLLPLARINIRSHMDKLQDERRLN